MEERTIITISRAYAKTPLNLIKDIILSQVGKMFLNEDEQTLNIDNALMFEKSFSKRERSLLAKTISELETENEIITLFFITVDNVNCGDNYCTCKVIEDE